MRTPTHNLSRHRFYRIWSSMKSRCKSIAFYLDKNIKVCKEWKNFTQFKIDMFDSYLSHVKEFGVKQTTLDRINNSGNYCKDNCRWATYKEQGFNRPNKGKTKIFILYQKKLITLKELSIILNININVINSRYRYGWSIEKIINTPVNFLRGMPKKYL